MSIIIPRKAIIDDLKLRKVNRPQGNLATMNFFNKVSLKIGDFDLSIAYSIRIGDFFINSIE
ncbi:MAG: hypothetical protein CK425_10190 [Parachlamydia sp.]|nr:MAG: hypothetical protein CK425_10190 [Parachlamydia sp.]